LVTGVQTCALPISLNGGAGNDQLLGGAGNDLFVFNTALAADNIETIADFATGDGLQLDRAIFTTLSAGATLTVAEFLFGDGASAATNAQQHHLFDTLYHAVALQTPGALCVTADRRYLAKAHPVGQIAWLGDYQPA
jgi:Ca2+-binding RTX toxin-like protein